MGDQNLRVEALAPDLWQEEPSSLDLEFPEDPATKKTQRTKRKKLRRRMDLRKEIKDVGRILLKATRGLELCLVGFVEDW